MHPAYRIDLAHKFVALSWNEFPAMERLRDVVREAVADPEFRPGMNFLWDRSPGQESPASTEYLCDALYYLQVLAERIGPHSWAIIAHSEADFGKARLLEARSDSIKVTVRAFKCSGDAEEWLRNPVRYEGNILQYLRWNPMLLAPLIA
jgi:hypothetical protein